MLHKWMQYKVKSSVKNLTELTAPVFFSHIHTVGYITQYITATGGVWSTFSQVLYKFKVLLLDLSISI